MDLPEMTEILFQQHQEILLEKVSLTTLDERPTNRYPDLLAVLAYSMMSLATFWIAKV